ncbi:MAG: hypothetical protein NVSMB5_24520 [Candidatus Velthaea sp.]
MGMTVIGPTRQDQGLYDFAVFGFNGLLNIKSAPQELNDNELTAALNIYGSTDGAVSQRRGMTLHGAQLSAVAGSGLARFFQQVINGVPQNPAVVKTLAQLSGNLYNVETLAQIGVVNVLGAAAQPWSIAQAYDPAHTGGASDCLVICTGSGGPYLFDGTSVTVPAAWTANVPSARWCALVNGVLWFAGVPSQPNLMWGSGLNAPETLPFYNTITTSRPVIGLGVLGAGAQSALVAGLTKGLAVIGGVGPSSFFQQEIPSTDGVAAGRSMITVDGILYFIGNSAIYRFDGQTISAISNKVEPWILNDASQQDFPMNGDRRISWSFYYNRRIYFVYDSGGVGYPNAALVWDLQLQGWTVMSGPKLYAAVLLDAPGDASPPLCLTLDATKGQVYNFDVLNAALGVDDAGMNFSTSVITKFFKIGDPGTPKILMRTYPEFFLTKFGGQFLAQSDYGASSASAIIPVTSTASALWDVSKWDVSFWAGGSANFVKQRTDFNLEGEAFAFGVSTNDSNPPYKFVGLSGTFSQLGRS